ncbi:MULTISPECIES: kinase [unclassified Marinobacter]|uniref:kinase n=1 Tax=unclassified Marinobacter TaxID=83889 RepID=UPI000BF8E671|nr:MULTISPECIES: kinase [unclassified Marinobacter]PFG09553.1 hypothetical protein ATI45_1936 [Marinobacter sp. LV10MA510-1]PFG51460.1 hypothetical protein ATG98_0396 [Marinobacter sp. LV10R520-4]
MSQDSKLYTTRSLILTAVVAIIGSVLVLEITGKIDHSDNKENLPIGEFTAIQVTPGEPFNMSSKASELHARCENGYLAIAADIDSSYRGVLVDYKNRGVRCSRPSPTGPSALPEPENPGQRDQSDD